MKSYPIGLLFFGLMMIPVLMSAQQNLKIKKADFKTEQELGFEEAWKSIKAGDKLFKAGKGTYREAREHYLFAAQYNPDDPVLNYKIGVCYLFSDDKFESIKYLEKAFLIDEHVSSDIRLMGGKAYQMTLNFEDAISQYQKYKESLDPKQRALEAATIDKLIAECESGKALVANPGRVIINNMGEQINSVGDDYNPVFATGDTAVYFTSRRKHHDKAKRSPIDNKHFEDIYVAAARGDSWKPARNMGKPVNRLNHNTAAVALSPDGGTLYIYQGHKSGGGVFRVAMKEGKWTSPKNIPGKLRSKYRETTLCFSPDAKTLYFVSDHEKLSTGGKDILFSEQDAQGKWKDPVNIGKEINSKYDEEGVFLSPDGNTLYFSSKGHNTMGGFDVFKSERNGMGEWSPAENLGYPVNSPDDDVFFKVTHDERIAYYSANRMGGQGGRDIYKIVFLGEEKEMLMSTEDVLIAGMEQDGKTGFFVPAVPLPEAAFMLSGKVYNNKTREGVRAKIDFIDVDLSRVIATTLSSDSGYYSTSLPEEKAYGVEVQAQDYLFYLDIVDLSGRDPDQVIARNFGLDPIEVGATVILENIFFELNKATLKPESYPQLEQVLGFMNGNPSVRMEISGHTDNTGSLRLNTRLSQARAQAVVDWLRERGVTVDRLDAKGYAFSQPISPNNTAEGRAKNRRVEFKILSK
jgi:outer membrane protein OmpA-like peptidoglycan-associated protein/tetratricopeptide (TPR) repeat protein